MTSRITRMRRGDRKALRELLDAHGSALEALRTELHDPDAPAELPDLAVAVWKESLLASEEDERAIALAAAAAWLARGPVQEQSYVPEVDLRAFAYLAAKVGADLGDELDQKMLEDSCAEDPKLAARRDRITGAIAKARAMPEGAASFPELWPSIEPQLR